MTTALDSSALLAVFCGEASAHRWLNLLIEARRQGPLVVCDVVYAEVAPLFRGESELRATLDQLGAAFETTSPQAAFRAGEIFRAYRAAGGQRTHLIPDFLIAAHALLHADRLAASDRGYLRGYYPDLKLLQP